jgi:hypothetical protein
MDEIGMEKEGRMEKERGEDRMKNIFFWNCDFYF